MSFRRRMRSLPIKKLKITDPFWSRWQTVLIEQTLPAEYKQIIDTGRLENFRRVVNKETGGFQGLFFNDSDIYKWLEACAYAIAGSENISAKSKLQPMIDEAIELIQAAQEESGYLNTYFQLDHPNDKLRNLNAMHEMYCAGHLMEAADALFCCLGDRRLLEVSIKFADHLMSILGPGKRLGYCGHEEIELALIRLSNATGDKKYREFARWMVEMRGHRPSPLGAEMMDPEILAISPWMNTLLLNEGEYSGEYNQDHKPIREHDDVVGHAVRAMYLYIAAADLADGLEDAQLEEALTRCWNNLVQKRMYVTGGIGPSSKNEGFTTDFDLPNMSAYAETCAACGLVFWGHKMLEMTGNGDYVEVIERALYNGTISGISLDGTSFYYDNPLESRGQHARVPWFTCACCPPNIARLIGNVGSYLAGASESDLYIHIPADMSGEVTLNGTKVRFEITGGYPWNGKYQIQVFPEKPTTFALRVRIPDWAIEVNAELPGLENPAEYEDGYAVYNRVWTKGEVLTIDLETEPTWVEADPRVRDDLGRTALTLGPVVYCAEEKDLGFAPQLLAIDSEAEIEKTTADGLPGIVALKVEGVRELEEELGELYRPLGSTSVESVSVSLIPYFAWNNRGANSMLVWLRRS